MVKIAVAGGTGNVATELLRPAIQSGKHDITIFTRSAPKIRLPGVTYKTVDYDSLPALTDALRGFHTCLSFLIAHLDTNCTRQKNLIHACIDAGVKRFAPSEWCLTTNSGVGHYDNKDIIARYLAEINKEKQVLEYCLFQPSVFMDYFAHPYPLSPGLITWTFFVDFENRRAIVLDNGNQELVVTCVKDDAEILALALSDERPWPTIGGVQGAKTTTNEIITLGKKIRGGDWKIDYVTSKDIMNDVYTATWVPPFSHPVIPKEQEEAFSKDFVIMFLKAAHLGGWAVSGEWNERFPDYRFTGLEEYLTKAWEGKP